MASTYTLNNGIELIGTGEQSGTWGDTTNTNLELLDTALDGQVTITAASAGSSGSPNSLPISDGSASNGRNRMVIITSATDLGSTVYYQLTPNDAEKIIYIRNSLNTQDLIVFQGTYNSSNDYVIKNGKSAVIYFDGAGAGAVAANVLSDLQVDALAVDTDTLYVDATNDRVGINQDTPLDPLHIKDTDAAIRFEDSSVGITGYSRIFNDNNNAITIDADAGNNRGSTTITMKTDGTSAMVIDSSQRVLIKQTSDIATNSSMLQVFSTGAEAAVNIHRGVASSGAGYLQFQKSRNTTAGSYTIVSDGDSTGNIIWRADDGTAYDSEVAWISAVIDGTPGANDTPGRLVFRTTADGAATSTERMRIDSSGNVDIGSIGGASAGSSKQLLSIVNPSGTANTAARFWLSGTNATTRGTYIEAEVQSTGNDHDLIFATSASGASPSEAMRINSSQNVLVGPLGAAETTISGGSPNFQVTGSDFDSYGSFTRRQNTNYGAGVLIAKSRNTSANSYTIVQDNDTLGSLIFIGDDGTDLDTYGAMILGEVDGTPGANDMPGRLVFSTTADGASSPTERMQINSSGNVGIGTSGSTIDAKLHLQRAVYGGYLALKLENTNANTGVLNYVDLNMNAASGVATIRMENETASNVDSSVLAFHTGDGGGAAEAMRIDNSRRVLIGHTSSIAIEGGNQNLQLTGTTSNDGLSIARFNADFGPYLNFGRSGSGTIGTMTAVPNGDELGRIQWAVADGTDMTSIGASISAFTEQLAASNDTPARLVFKTTADGASGPTTAMTIDSSQRLFVGKTASGLGNTGHEFGADGYLYHTRAGDVMWLNRTAGSSGTLLTFMENGGTVGRIHSRSTDYLNIQIGSLGTGITGTSSHTILPSVNNARSDNTNDLGDDSYRWKDLYLSGGVYLGGVGAANKLTDYETGTWLPTVEFQNVGSTATTQNSSYTTGSYTKVGDLVTVEFNIGSIVLGNGTGNLQMSLPFTHVGIAAYTGKNTASSGYTVAAETASGYSGVLKAYGVGPLNLMYDSGTSWAFINNGNASTISPNGINGQFTYHTNQ